MWSPLPETSRGGALSSRHCKAHSFVMLLGRVSSNPPIADYAWERHRAHRNLIASHLVYGLRRS